MLSRENLEIINGCLLGDGSIQNKKDKYFYFKLSAKDKNLLYYVKGLFNSLGIQKSWIVLGSKVTNVHSFGFYMNSYFGVNFLKEFYYKWYQKENGKTIKIVPKDLKLTPTTLFFWYLGDGSLIRRRNDETRVPRITLATNTFKKEDVEFLREKLKELGLNFYVVKSTTKTGFRKEAKTEYLLFSSTEDETVFKFFKIIGFIPPKEIENCILGNKGNFKKERIVKDKWPNEKDWIKILSNVVEVGKLIREKRRMLSLSQNKLAKLIGIRRENIRDVELMKRRFGVKNFEKVLKCLKMEANEILKLL